MPRGRHVTLAASTLAPCRLERPAARSAEVAAMRAQIAEAAKTMPATVDGRAGRPCTPQQAVAALLRWAGDDESKLRRALRRALELGAAPRPLELAAPHGPADKVPPPPEPRRWRPKASAFDPVKRYATGRG